MTEKRELTPEELAMLPGIRDEWLAIGLCTERADRPRAEAGARLAYQLANLEVPELIVWEESPMAGAEAAAYLVWADERGMELTLETVKERRGMAESEMKDRIWPQLANVIQGQHDAPWLSFYDACRRIGIPGLDVIEGNNEVAKSSGWWWAFDKAIVLTERPVELHRDQQNRLHNPNGPAISYPDGWGVYAWHGTRVPKGLIDPGWDALTAMRESNTEIRRCAVERYAEKEGWLKIVNDLKCKHLDGPVDDPGNPGQTLSLYRLEKVYEEPVNLLLMTNGTVERDRTRREFGETVPVNVTDAISAAAWQIPNGAGGHLSKEQYLQTARRT